MAEYAITFFWDEDAAVWIATSDGVPGLVLESGSLDVLMERVRYAVPELLALNGHSTGNYSLSYLRMTEKEAEYWDDYFTQNDPVLEANGTGYISQIAAKQMGLDDLTIKYIYTKSAAEHVSPAQIIGDLVRREIGAA